MLGFYALIGVGVSLQGHRRIVNVTQCGPQDQPCMEATLDALSTRGLGSGMRVTLPGNVALQSAVSSVWGSRVSVQRCLNTVMEEADPDDAMQFRHRLQPAWQQWDASSAQTSLQQITDDLTKVNRGQVLDHALDHASTDGASASQ